MLTSPSTDDLQMLQNSVAKWLDGLDCDALSRGDPGCNTILAAGLREMGLLGLAVAEGDGGADLGLAGVVTVAREMGRRRLVSPLMSFSLMAADALSHAEGEKVKALLQGVAAGEHGLAVAVVEMLPGSRINALKVDAGWTVSGTLRYVADMSVADRLLMIASVEEQECLFLVETSDLEIDALTMVDGSDFSHINLDDSPAVYLAAFSEAGDLESMLDRLRVGLAAEMLGLSEAALEMTAEYLRTREQFGQKIGSFQALQHRLAKAYIKNELAAASIDAAMCAKDQAAFARAATVAKAMASEALHRMSNECVQLHGGIGMTDEHIAGHYLKRARVLEGLYGDKKALADRYAVLRGY